MCANKKGLSRRDFLRSAAAAAGAVAAAPLLKAEASTPAAKVPALRRASGTVTFWQHYGGEGRPNLTRELIEEYKAGRTRYRDRLPDYPARLPNTIRGF